MPAGVKTQQQLTFKVKCKLQSGILQRRQLHSSPLKGLLQWSLMNVHMTDVLTELEKFPSDLRTIRVHFLNEK